MTSGIIQMIDMNVI